jgi:hypothetical protein
MTLRNSAAVCESSCTAADGPSSGYHEIERFDIENVEPLGKDLPCKSLPRNYRKANLLRRQAIVSSAKCYKRRNPAGGDYVFCRPLRLLAKRL